MKVIGKKDYLSLQSIFDRIVVYQVQKILKYPSHILSSEYEVADAMEPADKKVSATSSPLSHLPYLFLIKYLLSLKTVFAHSTHFIVQVYFTVV